VDPVLLTPQGIPAVWRRSIAEALDVIDLPQQALDEPAGSKRRSSR
jgi:hypothetical protein